MKLTARYPQEPPEVRFVTPVYHPNIEEDGKSTLIQRNRAQKDRSFY